MTEWILSSSILILIVIALRTCFKGKISLRLQYAVWGLVLLRLLIPFSFGSTDISVANLAVSDKPPAVQSTFTPNLQNTPNTPNHSQEDMEHEITDRFEDLGVEAEVHVDAPLDISRMLQNVLPIIWAIGFVFVAGLFLVTNTRFRRKIMDSRYALDIRKENLEVYVTGEIDTPCLFGIKNPAIYVTWPVADDPTLLLHTLEHEDTHYRHGDHIWAVLRCVCLAIHWYNPLVWWAAFLSRQDGELACDEATILRLGEGERAEYGRTLIGMTCQKRANVLITATTMNSGKRGLKERIMLIAKKPRMAVYTLIAVMLIAAIAVGCTFTGARDQQEETLESLPDYLTEYTHEQDNDRTDQENHDYIITLEDYSLMYCTCEGPRLILYRHENQGNQIIFSDQAEGEYTISGGLSVNHLVDGDKHIYFGTVSDYHWIPVSDTKIPINWKSLLITDENGTEHEIEMTGEVSYLCILDAPMENFLVIEHDDATGWDLTLAGYLNQGYSIHESVWLSSGNTTEPTFPSETTEPATEPPEETLPQEIQEDQPILSTAELDKNKVCIAIQPTGRIRSGEEYLYIIPEDQATLLEYYMAATASAHVYTQWDSANRLSGWQICYKGQGWLVAETGALFSHDPETWDDICIDPEDAKALYNFCDAFIQTANIGKPFRPEDMGKLKSAALSVNGELVGPIITDPYVLSKIETWISNSRESSSAACPFGAILTLEMEGRERPKSISIATDSCAAWMSNGVYYGFGEITNVGINGNEEFYSLFMTDIIHEKAKEGHEAMAAYWIYTNWRMYSNSHTIDETFALMDMFREYAVSNPTDGIVLTALTTCRGLDGAFAEYYAGVVAALFEADPGTFSFACRQMIPEQDVENAVNMLAYYWGITPEEARVRLDAARATE